MKEKIINTFNSVVEFVNSNVVAVSMIVALVISTLSGATSPTVLFLILCASVALFLTVSFFYYIYEMFKDSSPKAAPIDDGTMTLGVAMEDGSIKNVKIDSLPVSTPQEYLFQFVFHELPERFIPAYTLQTEDEIEDTPEKQTVKGAITALTEQERNSIAFVEKWEKCKI